MSKSPDPYAVLGVTAAATPAEISRAFRAKLRTLHPDAGNAGFVPTADEESQLQQLLGAYAVLRRGGYRAGTDEPPPVQASGNRQGPVKVPVNYRGESAPTRGDGLWAGPVRRHR